MITATAQATLDANVAAAQRRARRDYGTDQAHSAAHARVIAQRFEQSQDRDNPVIDISMAAAFWHAYAAEVSAIENAAAL